MDSMGAGATVLASSASPEEFLEEVEWGALTFFMALFVLVGSLVKLGEPISFRGFTKYGIVVTVATLVVAWLYVYLRYFYWA